MDYDQTISFFQKGALLSYFLIIHTFIPSHKVTTCQKFNSEIYRYLEIQIIVKYMLYQLAKCSSSSIFYKCEKSCEMDINMFPILRHKYV